MSRTRPVALPSLSLLFITVALAALLAACGSAPEPTATPLPPTLTPTPLSEPLPTVATLPPFGVSDRPFRLVIMAADADPGTVADLETFLTARTGQTFSVQLAETGADALDALCGDTPAAGWLDGLTLLLAMDRGCAEPTLQIRRGRGNAASNGLRADLIASADAGIESVADFEGQVFCRLGADSAETWLLPVMVMRGLGGFDPFRAMENVRDVPDAAGMVREVAGGACVGALPAGALRSVNVPGLDVREAVRVVATSPALPHGGLVFASRMPPGLAEQVTALFQEAPEQLGDLVEASGLVEASPATFSAALTLLREAGISAALGTP